VRTVGIAILVGVLALAGCGDSTQESSAPLGRSLEAEHASSSPSTAGAGDPPAERGGVVPETQARLENEPAKGAIAQSPQAALRRYALAYVNWRAMGLAAHERQLASLAIGPARLAAEQTAASQSAATTLAADHVENRGVVLAIAPGQGRARSRWVVVTDELTTGTGPYAGLPSAVHVTLAQAARVGSGWLVREWLPTR
jgi:hypothetical protein